MQLRTSCLAFALAAVLGACGNGKPPSLPDSGTPLPSGGTCLDNDGDGVPGTGTCTGEVVDCDDKDPSVHPGLAEVCDGLDNDCNGLIDDGLEVHNFYKDGDGDGYGTSEVTGSGCGPAPSGSSLEKGDCDDAKPVVHPGATETCNGVDDDCDGNLDNGLTFRDFYPDLDGDGAGDGTAAGEHTCRATVPGKVANSGDCNDQDPTVRPGATELCNKLDDNCDGLVDNGVAYSDYFPDNDGDGFGAASATAESACAPVPGKVTNNTDCDDGVLAIHPGAPEVCNGLDDDCDTQLDEGLTFNLYYSDSDGDGFGSSSAIGVNSCKPIAGKVANNTDCNDALPAVHPGAAELCNGADDDCNGQIDDGLTFTSYFPDADGDGYGDKTATGVSSCTPIPAKVGNNGDCDDGNPAVHPGATELCNNLDDDCDNQTDEGLTFLDYYPDADGDGYGASSAVAQRACLPVSGKVTNRADCDDALASVRPGATEVCNGRDDDCDNLTDEGLTFLDYYPDGDGDGFGSSTASAVSACAAPAGKVTDHTDCDDAASTTHPGAAELCNGEDDNCDGLIDNGVVTQNYYPDADGDGFGETGSSPQSSCAPVAGKVTNSTDCNDANSAIKPGAAEVCNGADDNCNGLTDEGLTFLSYYPDLDADGYGASGSTGQSSCQAVAGKVTNNTDCNDADNKIKPGVAETCNGIDDNCNGQIDEGLTFVNYYPDADSDTYGSALASPQSACKPVAGKVTNNTDCNDGVASIHPGAPEACNNTDDDCDGAIDEGNAGGGASCNTGQAGVCAAGTVTCQGGALSCLRNVAPSTEVCDNLDNDCNNSTDETFPNKGQACTSGQGVCSRSGTYVCTADKTATACNATAGPPTAAACDGLDNDCDGIVDEPYLSSTSNVTTATWADIEATPYYYSAGSCAGGANGSGTDALAGGALAMAGSQSGLLLQRLDTAGNPVGVTTSVSGYSYEDIGIAQAGDGYLVAGDWSFGPEIDLYYLGADGVSRAFLYSQFQLASGNSIDSLRVLRGNGKRVVLIWREVITGASPSTRIRVARVEPYFDGSTWSIRNAGGGVSPITSTVVSTGATVLAGLGADSTHWDWDPSQTCSSSSSLRTVAVAYLSSSASLNYFTMNENGSGKGTETVVRTESGTRSLADPEVAFFRSASADQWFIGYVTPDNGSTPQADLDFWLTTSPSWHYAYLQYATTNGANSIARPRASVTSSRIWLSALRYVPDGAGFTRQVMTRKIDFSGNKDPSSSSVELSATVGTCGSDPACRPGNKAGLSSWAAKGKVFYSASGSTPAGTYVSSLTCQ